MSTDYTCPGASCGVAVGEVHSLICEYRAEGTLRDLFLADEGGYFTWEDVDALRETATDARCFIEDGAFGDERAEALDILSRAEATIDRIEALLPPRTNSPTEHTPDSLDPEG